MNPLLLILATLPGVAISYAVFRVDKYEREPLVPLVLCFLLGAVLTFPAVRLERWAYEHIDGSASRGLCDSFLLAFGAVSLNEELLKFSVLTLVAFPRSFFNEPLDGIVYAVMAAMGFATLENITYADRFGAETVLLRSFTAVPAHLVFAVVQGYYVGLAKFDPIRKYRLLFKGFVYAYILHGMYDFLIFQNWSDWLFVLATLALYLCLFYCSTLIKTHLDNSPFRPKNR